MPHPNHAHTGSAAWRKIEWIGAALALLLMSGALFPLLLAQDGALDEGERSQLRQLGVVGYLIVLPLLLRHPGQFLVAAMRNIPMLSLIGLSLLSITWSIAPAFSLRRSIALMMSMMLAYVLAIRFSPRQQMLLFAAVLGLSAGMSLLMAAAAPELAFMPDETGLRGIFVHKNVMGWISAISVMVGIALAQDLSRGLRRVGWGLAATGFACVLLSESATSLLAAVLAILLTPIYRMIAKSRGVGRIVLNLILLQFAAMLAFFLYEYLLPLLNSLGKDATLTGRVPLWHQVDPEIARHPFIGYGYGAFWSEANLEAWRIWREIAWKAPHAHNGYRDLLLSVGMLGALVFAIVILQALSRGLRLQATRPQEGWVWCSLMISLSLLLNLSESTILMQNDLVWILTSTAILSVSYRYPSVRPQRSHRQRLVQAGNSATA